MFCLVLDNVFWIRFASSDDNEKRIVKRDGKKEGLFNDEGLSRLLSKGGTELEENIVLVEQFASLSFNNNHWLLFIKLQTETDLVYLYLHSIIVWKM